MRYEPYTYISGEYSNIKQEELFEWIKSNTPNNAVFAGKMSLMANLMLSTGRPIVNNPYYESKEMRYNSNFIIQYHLKLNLLIQTFYDVSRDRTMKVYEIFSRKDANSVYVSLRNMKVSYVVLEASLCLGYANL